MSMCVNMFFFRNLLFLTSLAFVTWLVLCYLDNIEENRELPQRLDLTLDNSLADMVKCEARYFSEYDAYINFICIFTGVYALAKIIEMVEIFFAPNIRATFEKFRRAKNSAEEEANGCSVNDENGASTTNLALDVHEATFTLDDYRKMAMSLREDMGKMWKRNKYLDHRIGELEQQNLLLMGKGLLVAREPGVSFLNNTKGGCDGENMHLDPYFYIMERSRNVRSGISVSCSNLVCSYTCDNSTQKSADGADGDKDEQCSINGRVIRLIPKCGGQWLPFQQNIFVGNRFFHFNNDMDINDGEFTQVWQKYLKMSFLNHGVPSDQFEPLSSTAKSFPAINLGERKIENRSVLKKMDFSKTDIDFSPEITPAVVDSEADIGINTDTGLCNAMPIVVTTEELETIQGLGLPKKAVLSG